MEEEKKISVVAVVGPTASGKSALAVELAKKNNGEIISADSMQIYKEISIGTAKPTSEEMQGITHYLVDCVELSQPFSVADYVKLAKKFIKKIEQSGKLPIIVGGTGLYIRSLLQNVKFTQEKHDPNLREALKLRAETEGPQVLLEELRAFDPESAQRLHPNNLTRIIRAIEIYRTTGITMTEQLKQSKQEPSPYRVCMLGLNFRDRQKLYERIDKRVDTMIENGLLQEAEQVLKNEGARTAMQAIGYKELAPYFCGKTSLAEAVENLKRETRHYAKRQLTWFHREPDIHWIYLDDFSTLEEILNYAQILIEKDKILLSL